MNKTIINVPAGIRFISEWQEFNLPENPCIINKQITGCGFTEWCIRNNKNVILCSPRKILLENKEKQHQGEVLYVRNELDKVADIDKDLNKDDIKAGIYGESPHTSEDLELIKEHVAKIKTDIINYYYNCTTSCQVCKYFIIYDSFRYIREALGDRIKDFYIIVDEFQSIFTDSRFKSSTELEFLNHLQGLDKLCFVSATPMMDEYLDMLDEFKDLPYYELNWGALDPGRVIKPELNAKSCQSILPVAENIIQTYQAGNFQKFTYQDSCGIFQEIESRELVIYVNSVKNICDIIRRCGLTFENTNVLCSRTSDNQKRIRKAFGLKKDDVGGIGEVPGKGETHKMFTLCTRTVYLGADFYSTCARSLILSDANIDCLAVDITLDLPQILGRQRLNENPWKNRAELYFKTSLKKETFDSFISRLNTKRDQTDGLLLAYSQVSDPKAKHSLAKKYQTSARTENYRNDYLAVNTHGGKDIIPVFNNLVMIAELRAFQIQQIDYKDRFTVVNQLRDELSAEINLSKVDEFLLQFNELNYFTDKMRLLCNHELTVEELNSVLGCIPLVFKNYYITLGSEKIKSLSYQKSKLSSEYEKLKNNQEGESSLKDEVYSTFLVNERYTKIFVKDKLVEIYNNLGIKSSPKATDLENYFEVKKIQIFNKDSGKKDHGYKLISKKL